MKRRSSKGIAIAALSGAAFAMSCATAPASESLTPGDGWHFKNPEIKEPQAPFKADVTALANEWLAKLENNTVKLGTRRLAAELEAASGTKPLPVYIRTTNGPPWLTIGIREPINAGMTPEAVTDRIEFIANNGFPPPGLSAAHWTIRLATPSTHAYEGFRVTRVEPGRLVIAFETPAFSVYGTDDRVEVWADAPSPDFSYVQIRKDMKIEVTFDVSITGFE